MSAWILAVGHRAAIVAAGGIAARIEARSRVAMTNVLEHRVLDEDAASRNRTAAGWPAPTTGGAPVVLGDVARRMPRFTRRITVVHAALFLRTRGRVLSRLFGNPILVLETVGRRTGRRRLTPLVYLPYRNNFAVLPANAGAHRPPAWWLNLQAAGEGFAVLNGQRHRITPTIATGLEHDRLWQQFCAIAPIEHYQRRARRTLPIIVLARAGAAPPYTAAGRLFIDRPASARTSEGVIPT